VLNSGAPSPVTIEFHLGIAVQPHTALLAGKGGPFGQEVVVRQRFWENDAQMVRFEAALASGNNRFVLSSKEPAELLPDGRLVCFLLIGDPVVTPRTGKTHRDRVAHL